MRAANVVTRTDNCVQDNNPLTAPSLDDGRISLLAEEYPRLLANQTSTSTTIA